MRKRTAADAIVAAWCERGVESVFGLDDPQTLFGAVRHSPIRCVIVHDERSGAFMADGYARASGRPTVCAGVSGPGATNLATGLLEAYKAYSPVVAVVGENTGTATTDAFQQAPHAEILGPLTKAVVRADPRRPAVGARAACDLAIGGAPRPVLLLANASGLSDEVPSEAPMPATLLAPAAAPQEVLEMVATWLAESERPMIVAGNGIHISRAYAELHGVAEAFGVPVVTSLLGKGAFPEDHRLSVGVVSSYTGGQHGHGRLGNEALAEADVVLAIGTDLDAITTSGGAWPRTDTRLIRIDLQCRVLVANAGLGIQADAAQALARLNDLAPRASAVRPWVDELCSAVAASRREIESFDDTRATRDGVWPGTLVRALQTALGSTDAIVTDASYSSAWVLDRFCQTYAGRQVFAPRGAGTLGWGLPAALGVKLARPAAKVVCMTGDGGLLFSMGELITASTEELPISMFILNNGSYAFQRHADVLKQGVDNTDLMLGPINWSAMAAATGWLYERLDKESDVDRTLRTVLASRRPTLVDVEVSDSAHPPITMFDGQAGAAR
jgi:acetolactate synthase-1/2/3 large subunit